MFKVFLKLWKDRGPYSEISGKWLGREPLSIYFHHILPKSKYEDMTLMEENIILLTGDEHQKAENDIYFYEEINRRRDDLLKRRENNKTL